jgi:hypothetical protein
MVQYGLQRFARIDTAQTFVRLGKQMRIGYVQQSNWSDGFANGDRARFLRGPAAK